MPFHVVIMNEIQKTGDIVTIVAFKEEQAIAACSRMIMGHASSKTVDTSRDIDCRN